MAASAALSRELLSRKGALVSRSGPVWTEARYRRPGGSWVQAPLPIKTSPGFSPLE
ncbi:uncharacterized protein V6R79_013902 [Siganus canaliculatus]